MKLAIMQPYFLPYLGYFQLIACVDKFVVYDDVSYIKGGWVNRNNIKVHGQAKLITIPLQNGRSGVPICDVLIAGRREFWARKMLRTVAESYANAPFYNQVFSMFESWIATDVQGVSELNVRILGDICEYIGLNTNIVPTSKKYSNSNLKSSERISDICKQEQADHYINAAGGRELYEQSQFDAVGVKLNFIDTVLPEYEQQGNFFVPGLSILDVLMNNSIKEISKHLNSYELI